MARLLLNDSGTKKVLSRFGLTAGSRLGRGNFCAVFVDRMAPDVVIKLTSDRLQVDSVMHFLHGDHFPRVIEDEGHVGTQIAYRRPLYLFRAERLKPLREADFATRRMARQMLRKYKRSLDFKKVDPRNAAGGSKRRQMVDCSQEGLARLAESATLPASLRSALQDVLHMASAYSDLIVDLNWSNLMVRGTDELILNDVVVDGAVLYDE